MTYILKQFKIYFIGELRISRKTDMTSYGGPMTASNVASVSDTPHGSRCAKTNAELMAEQARRSVLKLRESTLDEIIQLRDDIALLDNPKKEKIEALIFTFKIHARRKLREAGITLTLDEFCPDLSIQAADWINRKTT